MEKKEKKEEAKNILKKVRFLPVYWKVVATIILIFGGGGGSALLFTSASDFWMIVGVVCAALVAWLVLNMWLPVKETKKTKKRK